MKKIFILTLSFLLLFSFVPVSADTPNISDYSQYFENINGSGFWFSGFGVGMTNGYNIMDNPPMINYSWVGRSDRNIPLSNSGSDTLYVACCQPISVYITGSNNSWSYHYDYDYAYDLNISYQNGDPTPYAEIYNSQVTARPFDPSYFDALNSYSTDISLDYLFQVLQGSVRNVKLYVNGVLWDSPFSDFTIETEIELPCDIQAVESSFNFFNGGYGVTWKQGQYNWTQSGPLENVTRTMVWTVSYPTVSYVQSLYNQSFIDSTPLDVVRNAFNTVFNSGTSIYDIPEQYRATTNFFINIDSPELGSSYHTSYDSTTQQWALTQNEYSYSLVNGYQFNTGFFQQLYQLYGDPDLFSIALCYITPVRVAMYAVDDTQGIIYNPLSIYWLDLKQSNGTVLEYRNFGSRTTVTDDNVTDDTTTNDSVTGDDTPFVNPTEDQLNTNYNNSIQNSYNHTVNNYYNYNDINSDLLDYYLSFRDGGTEQDVQDAFGYLNATISSLSNVPVVLHNLFYNFFPLPVIRLMQALFIVFMVFMIIIIIKHLFR